MSNFLGSLSSSSFRLFEHSLQIELTVTINVIVGRLSGRFINRWIICLLGAGRDGHEADGGKGADGPLEQAT